MTMWLPYFVALLLAPGLATAQAPRFPVLPADAPAGAGAVDACVIPQAHGTTRCGVFRVHEDRAAAAGRTIDIAFVILDATQPADRQPDGVLLLPGGPGESFTVNAAPISRLRPELRRSRDVVLVDVRGVGRSASLSCTVPYPGGFASRFGTVFPLDHAAACRDDLARRARLDSYTTAASVDDMEELRRWLGYPAWNLIGVSYGTRVAQLYMRRHPAAVRTAVLNGVAAVSQPLYVQHAALLQRALDRLLAECAADRACGAAYPELDAALDSVLARFRAGPVPVTVQGRRVAFSAGDLAYALRGLLYARGGDVPALITQAAAGQVAPLAEYYVARTAQFGTAGGETGYHFSVLCAEDIAPLTDAAVAEATRGTFMGDHLIEGYRAVCRLWPHARLPAAHWEPVKSDVPTLLLSGARDPVTPPESADTVAAHLPNSLHVVVPNGGHGVGGPCIEGLILRLITTGRSDGLDAACVQAAPPTRFRLPW
jgi:pimeloyl-ACP methyl ester carboxylesterase